MNRILVIRGGAIGDFVLTLPAIKLLRDAFPSARLEILGYKHIAALAENRYYADAVRSIESGSLSRFFTRDSDLPADLRDYFGSFDLIVSYLYDPDAVFSGNVARCSRAEFIAGPSKLSDTAHAAIQLAQPLQTLGLGLRDPAARLYPAEADRAAITQFCGDSNTIVLHPGSGSEKKNWPVENWRQLGDLLLSAGRKLLVVGGEADVERTMMLKQVWDGEAVRFAENLPLPQLAALLEDRCFVGHDSGISHIAAAVRARCVLLFGPSDPRIWAPANENVTILRAPERKMERLKVQNVEALVSSA